MNMPPFGAVLSKAGARDTLFTRLFFHMGKSQSKQGNQLEVNEQFRLALDLLEQTKKNVFITGKAGTGKSTLLTYWRDRTTKNVVTLAPTGVAALNVQGQTIHSFFRFKPDVTVDKIRPLEKGEDGIGIYKKIDTIIIDEISMVRADLLDCIDTFLRLNGPQKYLAFGGVQMVFIGDLYQLPPVVKRDQEEMFRTKYETPYFFSAHVFHHAQTQLFHLGDVATFERIELDTIYRQKDKEFVAILNAIRTNTIAQSHLDALSSRWDSFFLPNPDEFWITLTTTNAAANSVNEGHLERLQGTSWNYAASISGEVTEEYFPTEKELQLKKNAQVMFVNNDRDGRWVNGTIGHVTGIKEDSDSGRDAILVELQDGEIVDVLPNTWEVFTWNYDKREKKLVTETTGMFTQYPLRLAWAITIHKSQGKTFDRAIIDIGSGTFVSGQLYVALSRCRTLKGMVLTRQVQKKDAMLDQRVVRFMNGEPAVADEASPRPRARAYADTSVIERQILQAIADGQTIKIQYQTTPEKLTTRQLVPSFVGQLEYNGKSYFGLEAYCVWQKETRCFRLDKIVQVEIVA